MWETFLKQGQDAYGRGEFESAEGLLRVALEQAPGDMEKAFILNHLAGTLRSAGKLQPALDMWKQALDKVTSVFGPDHAEAGSIVHNLAGGYAVMGRPIEAETCYLECLRIVRLQGLTEPLKVADYLSMVATFYFNTNQLEKACKLLEEAAARRFQVLGEHIEVARTMITLAEIRDAMGDHDKALADRDRARQTLVKVLGPEDKQVALLMFNQGQHFSSRRQFGQARKIFDACLDLMERTLGPESPDVGEVLEKKAATYLAEGKPEAAEPLYQRALSIAQKGEGESSRTHEAMRILDLARVKQHGRDYVQAMALVERALAMLTESAGPAHPLTLSALDLKVEVMIGQERYLEARELARATLKLRVDAHGANHPTIAAGLTSIAMTHIHKKEYTEAVPLLQQAVAIWDAGPRVPDIMRTTTLYNLGGALHGAMEYYEAEDAYQRALNDLEHDFGETHPMTIHLLTNMASLMHSTSRQGKARQLEERVARLREAAAQAG